MPCVLDELLAAEAISGFGSLDCMQVHVAGKGAAKEQELISWDEVKDQKDVYQAIRTSDGRQALVKAGGEHF